METMISFSPIVTFGSNVTSESKMAYGFSGAIQGLYPMSDKISIGSELSYTYGNYTLIKDFDGFRIPESTIYYESKINIQTLNVPLLVRYQTKTKWMFQVGLGISYVLGSKSKTDYVYSNWFIDQTTRTKISSKHDVLGKDFNIYHSITVGKGFSVFNVNAAAQVYYDFAFHTYDFNHSQFYGNLEPSHNYRLRPNQLGVKLGIILGTDKG
jgi:hypothetical protein